MNTNTGPTLTVFCGSRPGADPAFIEATAGLGRAAAARGIALLYGGTDTGTMQALAEAALTAGGRVIGVIPEGFVAQGLAHEGLSELAHTPDMAARKALMIERADAFVALPGGLGTLDELFEAWAMAQIKAHDKPVGLLNTRGYFDALLAFLDHAVDAGFIDAPDREGLIVAPEPEALLAGLFSL